MSMLLAIVCSFIAANIIGMLWYSKLLFGKPWMRMYKRYVLRSEMADFKKSMTLSFMCTLIYEVVLYLMLKELFVIKTLAAAVKAGIWLSIFFLGLSTPNYVFENKPAGLWLINQGNVVVSHMASCAIMGFIFERKY